MLVSHDRALLRSVCDEFWLVGRGVVAPFDGDLDDYQRYLLDESKRLREEAKTERAEKAPVAPTPDLASIATKLVASRANAAGASSQNLKKKLLLTETLVAQLQAEQSALHIQLSQTPPPADLAIAAKRLKAVDAQLAQAEEEWMALGEELEAHAS
jgi:ATP-binding cassette subfamily F protein 3